MTDKNQINIFYDYKPFIRVRFNLLYFHVRTVQLQLKKLQKKENNQITDN